MNVNLKTSNLVEPAVAANFLKVKPGTLDVWRSTGRYNLPFVRVGRLVRYRLEDLEAFLARNTATHTA